MRNPVTSDQQKNYLIKLGPHQPVLRVFPSDGKNRFYSEWDKEFEFLEYSTARDAAFCFVCFLFSVGPGREKSESAWTTVGVINWWKMKSSGGNKSGKLQQHFNSVSHKSALSDYCHFLVKSNHIDILIDRNKRNLMIEQNRILHHNTNIVKILFDVARTLGGQGLAFRGHVENEGNFYKIVELISRHNLI